MFESSKNHQKNILTLRQNPSKIYEKSIEKSRSEKRRPNIEKNRGLDRPKVENLAPRVLQGCRFMAGGVPTILHRRIEDCIQELRHADGSLARRILLYCLILLDLLIGLYLLTQLYLLIRLYLGIVLYVLIYEAF